MPEIERLINTLEMRLTRRPDIKTAIALTLRCWLAYHTAEVADPRAYLHKANHTAVAALRKNESDVRLYALAIFIAIEAERFDAANEMLDTAMGFKQFLKNNEPFYFAVMHFLYTWLEIRQKRARSAKKHMRTLQDFVKNAAPHPAYPLMLGMLHLSFYEFPDAYEYLTASWDAGCRSPVLFRSLYHYYRTAIKAKTGPTLLPVLRWAAAHRADIDDIVHVYQEEIRAGFDPAAGERIFQSVPNTVILREICVNRMMARDYSPQAFAYYREAERLQIAIGGLCAFLVKAAFLNGEEHVNHYTMAEFLRTAEMDTELTLFVYHLLLTDPALSDLVPEHKNEILQFSTYCLENGIRGRRANSLYYYFWMQCNEMRITGENVDKAEACLLEDLTRFEVYAPPGSATRFIYVTEREKKGMAVYELAAAADGGYCAYVDAVDAAFTRVCLAAGRKNILDETLTVRRMVQRAEPALYRHFFRKGEKRLSLLLYLSRFYLERLGEWPQTEEIFEPEEAAAVFEAALNEKDISKPFRMQAHVALGSIYYRTGRFDRALESYGGVDENYLDEAYIEQILHVFIQTHEWARAAGLIMRKRRFISNKALFTAVKQLSAVEHAAHHGALADAAYELLKDAWYDKDLLSVTLAHYNGGQAEWQELSRALAAINITEPRLDEIVLKNSIWMHQFDEDAQKSFVRMCGDADFSMPLLKRFMEYSAYEMIINDARPNYETLNLLEKACLGGFDDDHLIKYALCHVYLRDNISTFHSEQIYEEAVAAQEAEGLMFPVFRECREKRASKPYIEKNQPFLYRSLPDKNIWLYYRIDDESVFHAQPMRYLRFGLYLTNLPLFYREKLTYYFSEEMPNGSITTREKSVHNEVVYLDEQQSDPFFVINNAMIYEQMFKYEQVEKIITELVKDVKPVRSRLM